MSVDYYSYAVIGLKIDPSSLMKKTKKRGCNCKIEQIGKFCPECREPSYVIDETPIEGYDYSEQTFHGYKVVFSTDEQEAFICAIYAMSRSYEDKPSLSGVPYDIKKLKEDMKNVLGPLGFWNEKEFGLWSVLHCSY